MDSKTSQMLVFVGVVVWIQYNFLNLHLSCLLCMPHDLISNSWWPFQTFTDSKCTSQLSICLFLESHPLLLCHIEASYTWHSVVVSFGLANALSIGPYANSSDENSFGIVILHQRFYFLIENVHYKLYNSLEPQLWEQKAKSSWVHWSQF